MAALYDTIGVNYADLRQPDAGIAAAILGALGEACSVVNVGAGAGSYEPEDRRVVAVEPSRTMIAKRQPGAATAVCASAEALPFADGAFEAAMAVLTVHHWPDQTAGLTELRRVARGRVAILTFDPAVRPWLTDYLPGLAALDEAQMPPIAAYGAVLGPVRIEPVHIPHDCSDGFLYAYWRRPQAYLEARIRSGSSSFWALGGALGPGLKQLEADLESGAWERRYGDLMAAEHYDAGYRLVIAD
ncbi:MAG: class I SAM-dependent methyltransferase [Oceanicaulis sp.]